MLWSTMQSISAIRPFYWCTYSITIRSGSSDLSPVQRLKFCIKRRAHLDNQVRSSVSAKPSCNCSELSSQISFIYKLLSLTQLSLRFRKPDLALLFFSFLFFIQLINRQAAPTTRSFCEDGELAGTGKHSLQPFSITFSVAHQRWRGEDAG